mmetsp:Transcript_12465/g.23132  ORF Transcript_12465/g.23132 Transcript_12465/m.23132 type:complete len:359 (-) Transcript_12465:2039-3115(-)
MFLSNLLDSETPTIFELSMADNLADALRPAFEYMLRTIGERYEAAFHLFAWKDELYAAALLLVQRHYLATYDASFAENFYALKRVKIDPTTNAQRPLRPREKLVSLIALALVPYLRGKIFAWHEQATLQQQSQPPSIQNGSNERDDDQVASPRTNSVPKESIVAVAIKNACIKGIPLSFAAVEGMNFLNKVMFLFNKTEHYSPSLWLQGVVLARITGEDMREQALRQELEDSRRGFLSKASSKVFGLLRTGLIASAIIFKVIEWYYSPENATQRETMRGPTLTPPPPLPPTIAPGGVRIPRNPQQCPICHEVRKNPAIASSGLTFCYECIHRFALEHGQCPVTAVPCAPTQIRRIFVS